MDSQIVTFCRAAACATRLYLLQYLSRNGETPPKELAEDLQISVGATVNHLRRLLLAGLIAREGRDARKWYSVKTTGLPSELHRELAEWINRELQKGELSIGAPHHRAIFRTVTILANERRIAIIRCLSERKSLNLATLVAETKLPAKGVSYHLQKLLRRGVITKEPKSAEYSLCTDADSLFADLLARVSEHWPSRSE